MIGNGKRFILIATILVATLGAYLAFQYREIFSALVAGGDHLKTALVELGPAGPLAIIFIMTTAVVVSPLPSAPIAIASGALYGHAYGAVYVLIGAQLGAMICFAVARGLGYNTLHRWFGEKLKVGLLGSQRALSYGILVSRLIPFVSFDIVSYAAGLTVIRFWRFAIAHRHTHRNSAFELFTRALGVRSRHRRDEAHGNYCVYTRIRYRNSLCDSKT